MTTAAHHSRRVRRGGRRPFSRRPLTLVLFTLVSVALAGGAVAYAFYGYLTDSDRFRVKRIRVEGAEFLKEQEIVAAAGLTTGDNVLFLDVAEVEARVRSLPYVKTCRVTGAFPDTVIVTLSERKPVATLLIENRMFLIDDECVVLRELGPHEPREGPFITNVPNLGFVEPGRRLAHRPLTDALAAWNAFSSTAMARQVRVSEIAALYENDIRMYCDGLDYVLRWGRGHFSEQARFLDVLWLAKGGQIGCHEYLDLRFGNYLASK